jgi:hypothetical protein
VYHSVIANYQWRTRCPNRLGPRLVNSPFIMWAITEKVASGTHKEDPIHGRILRGVHDRMGRTRWGSMFLGSMGFREIREAATPKFAGGCGSS